MNKNQSDTEFTIRGFKTIFGLSELPPFKKSILKKYAYMGYFKFKDKIWSINLYGEPGYIEIYDKPLPEDINL